MEQSCAVNYSIKRERGEIEAAGGEQGSGRYLDQPAADVPRHPGAYRRAPRRRNRPLLAGVRAPHAVGARGRPSTPDERDRGSAGGQPEWDDANRRPARKGRPDSARDAAREPQDRPRPAHRPRAEGARRGEADLSDPPSRDLRQPPRRQRGGRATPRPAAPARGKRRLAGSALQPDPRQAAPDQLVFDGFNEDSNLAQATGPWRRVIFRSHV